MDISTFNSSLPTIPAEPYTSCRVLIAGGPLTVIIDAHHVDRSAYRKGGRRCDDCDAQEPDRGQKAVRWRCRRN